MKLLKIREAMAMLEAEAKQEAARIKLKLAGIRTVPAS